MNSKQKHFLTTLLVQRKLEGNDIQILKDTVEDLEGQLLALEKELCIAKNALDAEEQEQKIIDELLSQVKEDL